MRLPSASGTSDGGHCCRCVVSGALFFPCDMIFWTGVNTCDIWPGHKKKLRGRDTPPIQRRYRWWRGVLKGAVAGTSPAGPWTDGRTGVRTPDDDDDDDDEHHPWRISLDRPCLLCYKATRGGGLIWPSPLFMSVWVCTVCMRVSMFGLHTPLHQWMCFTSHPL